MTEKANSTRSTRRSRGHRHPELRIVLDTNQVFTRSASDLLTQEVFRLIEDSRRHTDITLRWFLPQIVRDERHYQMKQAAEGLLPALDKLQRLLGHNLGISNAVLEERIVNAVDRQVAGLRLEVLELDATKVDLQRLTQDAAFRLPPFDKGKHEKGFRDAIVAETFLQLVEASPRSGTTCRVVLVTGDGLLRTAVERRSQTRTNVRVLESLDELKSLINTLVSEVTEEFVREVQQLAQQLFFRKEDQATLYYREGIHKKITTDFGELLSKPPEGTDLRENGTWLINPPRFREKKRQRVHWVSTIEVPATAYRLKERTLGSQPTSGSVGALSSLLDLAKGTHLSTVVSPKDYASLPTAEDYLPGSSDYGSGFIGGDYLGGAGALSQWTADYEKVAVENGKTRFEVYWSVTVTAARKLTRPAVDKIEHLGTSWED